MAERWPLTGRSDELGTIAEAMAGKRGIVLAGAAGVGKTRLAREVLLDAARAGATTRWAFASASARGLPLGAFSPIIAAMDGNPAQLVRHAIDALAAGTDPVVGVDDAHLLDELSALVLYQLVAAGRARVIVTVRTGEPAPEAVTGLWAGSLLDRLEVQPLPEAATAELVAAALGGPLDSGGAARLFSMTQGNALFLRQLVVGEQEAGRLVDVGGVWRWSGAAGVSPVLTELVRARMGTLPGTTREVVDMLALGEPLGRFVLADLTSSDAMETAEEAGLVGFEQDGQRLHARLAHPLYGEVRRTGIGQLRARRLRGAIATALADTGGRRADDTLRRAILAVDSDLSPDPALLTAAAGAAIGLLDLPLAERLARAAVAAGGGYQARLTLADALSWLSRGEEANHEYVVLADSATTDWERIGAAFPRAANLFYIMRRPADAEAVLAQTQAAISDEGGRLALTGLRAAFQIHLGRPQEAVRNATAALAVPGLPTQVVVMTTYGYVCGLGVLGQAGTALPAAERAYAAADESFDGAVPALGLAMMHAFTLRMAGYLEKSDQIAAERRSRGGEIPGTPQAYAATLMGLAALGHGRLKTAARWLRESRAGLRTDTAGYENACLMAIAETAAKLGDLTAAHEALDLLDSQPHPTMQIFEPDIELARAWLAAAEATVTEAIAYANGAARIARDGERHAQEVLALQTALQFGDESVVERLRTLAPLVDGPRGPAALAHAEALAAGSGDALLAATRSWEELGELLAAADAAAQAATTYLAHDQRKPAAAATTRAHQLAADCEGARTPALLAATRPLPLTGREREIVSLAAQGLTNQQIADRLTVSVRTVEGHLYRAGSKLGTANRADFAALLNP